MPDLYFCFTFFDSLRGGEGGIPCISTHWVYVTAKTPVFQMFIDAF
jgi:hypothetical protein